MAAEYPPPNYGPGDLIVCVRWVPPGGRAADAVIRVDPLVEGRTYVCTAVYDNGPLAMAKYSRMRWTVDVQGHVACGRTRTKVTGIIHGYPWGFFRKVEKNEHIEALKESVFGIIYDPEKVDA